MSLPPPTAHPSLLTSISQMQLVGALLGGLGDFQTDPVFQFNLPSEPDPAWTLRTFFGGCVGVWFFAFFCFSRALAKQSDWAHKWAHELLENLTRRGRMWTMFLPLGIFVTSFFVAYFSPGCICGLKIALDYALPSTWERGTTFLLIEAPSVALWYLQHVLHVLRSCLWIGLGLFGLASILLCLVGEVFLLAYPVLVITTAWTLIYLNLINSAYSRLFSRSRGRYRLRLLYARVAAYNRTLDLRAVNRQKLYSLVRQPGLLTTPSVANIGHAYLPLLKNSPTYDYRRCSAFAEWQGERIYRVSYMSDVGLPLAAMLDKHFQRGREEILDRSSFVCSAGELAGLFTHYLLPLPSLRHLRRSFRLTTFLAILIPYHGLKYLLRYCQYNSYDTWGIWQRSFPPLVPLTEALDNFRSSSAYTKLASPEEAVIAFLSAL